MRRSLFALLTTLALASAADAVSVELVADEPSYLPGETITISVVVDATSEIAQIIYGRLVYNPSILLGGSSSQNVLTSNTLPWTPFALACTNPAGTCEAFYQFSFLAPTPADQPPGFVISTLTFTAGALGSTTLDWAPEPGLLDFFGLTNAAGLTVNVVPEPASAALLGLGLFALAAARSLPRGRSR